jgi:hypothetical protein
MAIRARLKRALKWLLAPILRRMTAGMNARIAAIESGWNHYLPTFLSAVSSVGAFGHELLGVRRDLERQIAVLRGEIEGLSRRIDDAAGARYSPAPAKARIAAPEKVAAAQRTGLKLNLGCGQNPREGFINVDRDPLPGVDVIADPGDLPFEPTSVAEIYSAKLLDRIPQRDLRDRLLPFWFSLLIPGGKFRAVARDAGTAVAALAAGKCSFDELRAGLLEQDDDGCFRGNLFTPDSLSRLLAEAGFVKIKTVPAARSDGRRADFEISAERPFT